MLKSPEDIAPVSHFLRLVRHNLAMSNSSVLATFGLVRKFLGALFPIVAGSASLLYGIALGPMPTSQSQPVGAYSFHIFGAILICVGLVQMVFATMKARAPAKQSERLTESGDITFDADAAIANYLERKRLDDAQKTPQASVDLSAPPSVIAVSPSPQRPVFGRKSS